MKKKTFTSERVSKGVMVGLSRAVKKKKSSSFWGGDGDAKCPPFPGKRRWKEGRNGRKSCAYSFREQTEIREEAFTQTCRLWFAWFAVFAVEKENPVKFLVCTRANLPNASAIQSILATIGVWYIGGKTAGVVRKFANDRITGKYFIFIEIIRYTFIDRR